MIDLKIKCKTCPRVYPCYIGNFSKQNSNKSGFTLECVKCRQVYYKEYRARTVEQRSVYQNNYYNAIKEARRIAAFKKEESEKVKLTSKELYKFKRIMEKTGKMHGELYKVDTELEKNNSWMNGKERHSMIEAGLYGNEKLELLTYKILKYGQK